MAYRSILWRGVEYESISEIAVGEVLEAYVSGWTVKPGVSFQVVIGGRVTVDFVVGEILLEYHPFRTPWRVGSRALARAERLATLQRAAAQAARSYESKRRTQIGDVCPAWARELVVVGSGRELLETVVKRCASRKLPAPSRFEHDFDRRIKELARKSVGLMR